MELDEMMKYAIWIAFFIIALFGIYFLLKKFGIL
jgi:hypothetical protein